VAADRRRLDDVRRAGDGGVASLAPAQQNITPQNTAWAQQLEIWITPWGFLKAAAANNATVQPQAAGVKRYQVVSFNAPVKSPSGKPYHMVGYINSYYRDGANGLKFPAQMVQKRGGWPTFTAYILGAHANPPNIQQLLTAPQGGRGGGGVAPGGGAAAATGPASEKLADGVFRINGAYNSLAVEFADYILRSSPDRRASRARRPSSPRPSG
jgi:hypothetical protein